MLRDQALAALSDVEWLSFFRFGGMIWTSLVFCLAMFGPFHQKHLYRVDGKLFRIGHEAPEEVSDVLIHFDAEIQLVSSAIQPSYAKLIVAVLLVLIVVISYH